MRRLAPWAVLSGLLWVGACSQSEMGLTKAPGACNASAAQFAVDQAGDSQLGERAKNAAGAKNVRWIKPGEVNTTEFDSQRLLIEVDATNKVIGVRCG